ncbi:MAG: PAS domain S-box protein [Candidatus Methanogasteraceae archaeon]
MNETTEKWRTLIEEMPIGVMLIDCNRKIRDINKSATDMIGRAKEEILGRVCHEFVCPMAQNDCPVYGHEKTLDRAETVLLSKDRGEVAIEKTVTKIVMGGATLLVEMFSDITERKSAEESLREGEERFRAIFETAQDSIFIKDRSLRYIQANPAMEKLLGAPVSELIGRTDDELFGGAAGAHIRDVDSRILGGAIIEETDTKPVDGVPRTFHTIKVPIRDSSGEIAGLCGIARDITRQKELEQKLHDSFDKLMNSYKELAIPVIQVHDGVLAIPIMGALDDMRINRLTETMLAKIADTKTSVVILDLTAVRSIDSDVANRLLETVAAARLLGADCILSGIGPEVAAATVRLGLDEMDLVTRGSLQEGLVYAMQRVGGDRRRTGGLRR